MAGLHYLSVQPTTSSVTVPASTTTATTLNYNLISVRDATPITEQTSSGSAMSL
jgi:hypothetical protein